MEEPAKNEKSVETPTPASEKPVPSTFGRTVFDLLVEMKITPKSISVMGGSLFAVVALLLLSGMVEISYGEKGLELKRGAKSGGATETVNNSALKKELLELAQKKGRDYFIPTATLHINLVKEDTAQGTGVRAEFRTSYTVIPFKPGKDVEFKEMYSTTEAWLLERFHGTDKEENQDDGGYRVVFEALPWQMRTLLTGANFHYHYPWKENRKAFGGRILLQSNEQFFSYPNDADVIGEMNILIESKDFPISPIGKSAKRQWATMPTPDEQFANFQKGESGRTISARWENLGPGEQVGIHFKVEGANDALAAK